MENRTVIIAKIIKLQALGKSERQLGNIGAATTIEEKVKIMLEKHSISPSELQPNSRPNPAQSQYSSAEYSYEKTYERKTYSDIESILRDHLEAMKAQMEKEERRRGGYQEYSYSNSSQEKTYRWAPSFVMDARLNVLSALRFLVAKHNLKVEDVKVTSHTEGFIFKTVLNIYHIAVQGNLRDLTRFKEELTNLLEHSGATYE